MKFINSMINGTAPDKDKNLKKYLLLITEAIEEEISSPTQKVRHILDLNCKSEKRVREFLTGVSAKFKIYLSILEYEKPL